MKSFLILFFIFLKSSPVLADNLDWKLIETRLLGAQNLYNLDPGKYEATLENDLRGVNCWGTFLYIMGFSKNLTFGTEFEIRNVLNSNYCSLVGKTRDSMQKFKPGQILRFHEDPLRETHISLIGKDGKYWHKMSPDNSDLILKESQDGRFKMYFDENIVIRNRSFKVPMNDIYIYECSNLDDDAVETKLMSLYKEIEATKRATGLSLDNALDFFQRLQTLGNYSDLKSMTTLQLRNSYFVIFQLLAKFFNEDHDPTDALRQRIVSEVLSRSDFLDSIDVILDRMHPNDLNTFVDHLILKPTPFESLPVLLRKNLVSSILNYSNLIGFNISALNYISGIKDLEGYEKEYFLNSIAELAIYQHAELGTLNFSKDCRLCEWGISETLQIHPENIQYPYLYKNHNSIIGIFDNLKYIEN